MSEKTLVERLREWVDNSLLDSVRLDQKSPLLRDDIREVITALTQAQARCAELDKLLRECLEMADNWPGIAYSDDLVSRAEAALKEPH